MTKAIITEKAPEYSLVEFSYYKIKSPQLLELFKMTEKRLGRILTITEEKILFSFYDWLHMPFDLIDFLVEYCISNNHRSMRYIERVAISWIERGITTIEQAKKEVLIDKNYYLILSSLGYSRCTITPSEKACMDKWMRDYNFNMEIILEACRRTVINTTKPNLNYVHSILTNWHANNVQSLDDIVKLGKQFTLKKQTDYCTKQQEELLQLQTENNTLKNQIQVMQQQHEQDIATLHKQYIYEMELMQKNYEANNKLNEARLLNEIADLKFQLLSK